MSWNQLLSIVKEARELATEEARRPMVACPDDGTQLEEGPRNELHCRFCGWTDQFAVR